MNNAQTWPVPTFKPSVDYKPHNELEKDVTEFLEANDFMVHQSTYHEIMPENLKRVIQNRFTPTCLYLRGRADRIAIHKTKPIDFEWEAKTHHNPQYGDLTIEILPLLHHIKKMFLGVRCLYVYRLNGIDGGFWVNELPKLRQAWIPPRKQYVGIKTLIVSSLQLYFPNIDIVEAPVNGSGDPFIIIDKSVIATLKPWKELIKQLMPVGEECVKPPPSGVGSNHSNSS